MKQTLINKDKLLNQCKELCERCGKRKRDNGVMCRAELCEDIVSFIEDAEEVEAIPVEWIEQYLENAKKDSECYGRMWLNGIEYLLRDWRKENENKKIYKNIRRGTRE